MMRLNTPWEVPIRNLYQITPIYWPIGVSLAMLLHSPINSECIINSSDCLPKKPLRQCKELGSTSFPIQETWVTHAFPFIGSHNAV